jgi:hypothetical protein
MGQVRNGKSPTVGRQNALGLLKNDEFFCKLLIANRCIIEISMIKVCIIHLCREYFKLFFLCVVFAFHFPL